ncbi:Cof-type HAD-IIB family hydrolase [Bacillus sp. FSL W7-1360]
MEKQQSQEEVVRPIRLVAIDMDGTLLNREGKVSEGNKAAITEMVALGVTLVISTGRCYPECTEHTDGLNLREDFFFVNVNGSEIRDKTGQLLYRSVLDQEVVDHIYDLHAKHEARIWGMTTARNFSGALPDRDEAHEWMKFGFDTEDDDVRESLKAALEEKGLTEITNSSPYNIEVNALGINKAAAIKQLGEKLGITMNEVMAIGDSLNDIAMIREAGVGVAMGNAQDVVKQAADWITATNEQDGVAAAIQRWVIVPQTIAHRRKLDTSEE